PATLTVTANHQTKVYGQSDPTLTYTSSGFQFSDTAATVLTGALARTAGETVAGSPYAINQGTLAANSNYTISFTGNTLDITPATLTVTFSAADKPYDGTATAAVSGCTIATGRVNSDDVGCTVAGGTFASANAGTQTVSATATLTGTTASNYTVTNP